MLTIRRGFVALSLAAVLVSGFAVSASADNSDLGYLPPSVEGINPHPGQLDGGQGGTNGGSQGNQGEGGQNEHDGSGNGNGNGNPKGGATTLGYYGASTISYRVGAPVMTGGINVYAIYYGNWDGAATASVANNSTGTATTSAPAYQSHAGNRDLINAFLGSIGGTSHFKINTGYYSQAVANGIKTYIQNSVTYKASTTTFVVGTTKKTTLSDADIKTVVTAAIANNASFQVNGKPDPNGLYYVFTSAGIAESSGFISKYCGWHSAATINTVSTKFSFVGDPSKSIASCAGQTANSPHSSASNNLVAGDAMVSVIVHELEETATDPQLNAWYDTSGYENGDKCAWTFGTATSGTNGLNATAYASNFSTTYNGATHNWLLQQNWQIAASPQSCVVSQ